MNLKVTAEHEETYVAGFPMMVVVWVTPGPGSARETIDRDWLTSFRYTTVTVTDLATHAVVLESKRRVVPFDAELYTLEEGQRSAFLLDFSALFPGGELPPGRYSFQVHYMDAVAEPFEAEVRAASTAERERLALLKAETAIWNPFLDWSDWSLTTIRSEWNVHPPTSKTDPLRYYLLFRYLEQGPYAPADVPARVFDAVDGMYAPFVALLRVDLAFAKGRTDAAQKLLEDTRAAHPEVAWDLDVTERVGTSSIQRERDMLPEVRANDVLWAQRAAHPSTTTTRQPETVRVIR